MVRGVPAVLLRFIDQTIGDFKIIADEDVIDRLLLLPPFEAMIGILDFLGVDPIIDVGQMNIWIPMKILR